MRGRTEPQEAGESIEAAVADVKLFEARPVRYKQTQFLISDEMKAALRERSYKTGRSMSELVREAVERYMQQ